MVNKVQKNFKNKKMTSDIGKKYEKYLIDM